MGKGALLLTSAATLAGCLVTGEIDFQVEENVPPVILDKPGESERRIGSILWLDASEDATWELLVNVRDENTTEPLVARWRVETEDNMDPAFKSTDLPGVGELLRELSITLDQGDLDFGQCHRLQVVVSGSFVSDRDDNPALFDFADPRGDIGRATWWLWEGKGEALTAEGDKAAINDSCASFQLEGAATEMQ